LLDCLRRQISEAEKYSLGFVSMKMGHCAFTLVLALFLALGSPAAGLSLREQLALAEKDEDTYAQIELIRRILEQEPRDTALRGRLADLWLSIDDLEMAESIVRDWQKAPAALRAQVLAAVLFVREGKKPEAVALLERYLAEHPEDLEMTRRLAGYLDKMGEQKKAVDLLSKAPGVQTDASLLVARAVARRSLQDFAGALRDFEAADRTDPENESVVNNRPSFDRLRTAVAGIRAASNVLAEQPRDSAALISRAYWYLSTGAANGAAFNDAEAARNVDPHSVAALILFAEASSRTGRLSAKDAREKLEVDVSKPIPTLTVLDGLWRLDRQISKDPKDVSALLRRSVELRENAQQGLLALRDAQSALSLDPTRTTARAAKMSALAKLGKIEEAIAELRTVESTKSTPEVLAESLSGLAEAALGTSQLELALAFSDRAIAAKPQARFYRQRAAILQRLERYADSQEDLARAQQLETGAIR
jgi:tetratricopeptide (TPR) repeat protein